MLYGLKNSIDFCCIRLMKKAAGGIAAASICPLMVIFCVLIGGNLLGFELVSGYEPTERRELRATMKKLDRLDCYDDRFYKSTYIMNAVNSGEFKENNQATIYAKQLLTTGEYRTYMDVAVLLSSQSKCCPRCSRPIGPP